MRIQWSFLLLFPWAIQSTTTWTSHLVSSWWLERIHSYHNAMEVIQMPLLHVDRMAITWMEASTEVQDQVLQKFGAYLVNDLNIPSAQNQSTLLS